MQSGIPPSLHLPTNFYIDGELVDQYDEGLLVLPRGTGVIWHDGRRLRVADAWFSYDKHGRFDFGFHVFLEEIRDSRDDLPKRLEPDYFGQVDRAVNDDIA